MTRKEELAKAIKLLGEEGDALFARALKAKDVDVLRFGGQYQKWYSKALRLVEVLAPDRLKEFVSHYERDPKRKSIDALTYSIQDFVLGIGPTELTPET